MPRDSRLPRPGSHFHYARFMRFWREVNVQLESMGAEPAWSREANEQFSLGRSVQVLGV